MLDIWCDHRQNSQKGETVVAVQLYKCVPARLCERRRITPLVVIDRVEVAALSSRTTVHVLTHEVLVLRYVGGGIANWNLSVTTLANILFHVTGHSLDVGRRVSVVFGALITSLPLKKASTFEYW